MDRDKIKLLYSTLKHLKFRQVYYRAYYFIKNKLHLTNKLRLLERSLTQIIWVENLPQNHSFVQENTFSFLNISHSFNNKIDWNFNEYGKLWTYNLNYFDFLNQENLSTKTGVQLINDYIKNDEKLVDGKEPYPISLRGINWVKFLSKSKISDIEINQELYNHYQILSNNIEYHLLGNHLLENGFSLLFGAYYFEDETLYKKATQILNEQLDEQILNDGGHFELSPMYHQILLHRCLDCINLIQLNSWKQDNLLSFLKAKATNMLSWLQEVTFNNGEIPMVNDSAFNIAPSSYKLFEYASKLNLYWNPTNLSDSGYRVFKNNNLEVFIDIGKVGPTYQPGHAHSDTFNFVLNAFNEPFIVDVGTSTYEKNDLRLIERSTEAHNTVKINDINQTQVWDGFRVAKRANVIELKEKGNRVSATHNGYKDIGVFHKRDFIFNDDKVIIQDLIKSKNEDISCEAFLHFHPDVENLTVDNNQILFKNNKCKILFKGKKINISKEKYKYAFGFNNLVEAQMLRISFEKEFKTEIFV